VLLFIDSYCIAESWGSLSFAFGVGKKKKEFKNDCRTCFTRECWERVETMTMMMDDDGIELSWRCDEMK
jgi:hypothetical protein